MKQKLLLIDGMYFCQRVLAQCNMNGAVNNLETVTEQRQFTNMLNAGLINLWNMFKPVVNQMVYVTDNGSWRKSVSPFRPYYIPETTDEIKSVPIGYKDNRKEKKEQSPINYDNFYRLSKEFVNNLIEQRIIPVFNIPGMEGDDNFMMLAHKLGKTDDTFSIVFATDGDLEQIVRYNVVMFKNIRSKQAPNGELIMSFGLYDTLFTNDVNQMILGDNLRRNYFNELFSLNSPSFKHSLNSGISIANPFRTALIKTIGGDKKDNIFSLLSWFSSTGTRQYKITEKHIAAAFAGLSLNDKSLVFCNEACKAVLSDIELTKQLIINICSVTKQQHVLDEVGIDRLMDHFRHNRRMNLLVTSNLPDELRIAFDNEFEAQKTDILSNSVDEQKLEALNHTYIDKAMSAFEDNLPIL